MTDDLLRAFDDNKSTCLILLDFSKAFDTLNHAILCTKLRYFGLSEAALLFFHNYLTEREQRVVINNCFSETIDIEQGVPQGSILGPLLFSVYTADFYKYLNFCKSHQYADDTQLYYSFSLTDINLAVERINSDLNAISDVSKSHGLILNENKTQMLLLSKNKNSILEDDNFKIILNNLILQPSDNCKNLGIFIDADLRFSQHVSHLIRKSFAKLKILYVHKDFLSTDIKLRLCDSLILSHLAYCDTVFWPALLQNDRDSLQKIQNCCLRFCFNLRKFDHISAKFKESNWLNLSERFQVHLACLIFKVNLAQSPQYLLSKLVRGSDIHIRPTRHCELYNIPKHNTALFERSFSFNAAKIYNSLPNNLKDLSSVASFRKRVKAYTFSKRNDI